MAGPALPVVAEPAPCLDMACSGPCCDLNEVPLLEADVALLERATGQPRAAFVDEHDGWLLLRGAGALEGGCVFKRGPSHPGAGCGVHAARPSACRTYPFVLGDDGVVRRDLHCSYPERFVAPEGIASALTTLSAALDAERDLRRAEARS